MTVAGPDLLTKPAPRPRGPKDGRGYRVFQGVNAVILTLVVVVTLYPFLNIIARSLSDQTAIVAGQVVWEAPASS